MGGSGTVTTVSVTTSAGISGTVSNPTTTPAITLTLGAIQPASVTTSNVTISPSSGTALTINSGGASITGTVTATTFSGSGSGLTGIPNSALVNNYISFVGQTGINITGNSQLGGTLNVYNTGVTSNVAGTGISISGATGAVTITNTGVTSFNSRTGAVSPASGDYNFSQLSGTVTSAQMPAFSGDVNSTSGTTTLTLGTVNSNAGSFGNAVNVPTFTVNGKGLITAASNTAITFPVTSVFGRTGAVAAAANDYAFSQIFGALAATQLPAFTGDVTSPAGSSVNTLANVNSSVGTYTNATITVNAKGLVTAASSGVGGGVTSITGTANQVIASAATGAVTLSLPQSIATTSTPTFSTLSIGTSTTLGTPSSYGCVSLTGGAGGYSGVQFSSTTDLTTLMVQNGSATPITGMYNVSNSAWMWYFAGSTLTVGTVPGGNVSGNIAGTAAGITGLTIPAAGAVPGANGIPRTDANGYLYTYYINDNSPTESFTAVNLYANNGSDNFIRRIAASTVTVGGATTATNANNVITYGGRTDNANYPVVWSNPGGTTAYQPNYSCNAVTINSNTGTLNATIFNSTSDINKKTNIIKIDNALDIIESLNGVRFNWKDNGQASAGLIAQDVEKVMPELVTEVDDFKTLNYNGIIGALIEAIKEMNATYKSEIAILKSEIKLLKGE